MLFGYDATNVIPIQISGSAQKLHPHTYEAIYVDFAEHKSAVLFYVPSTGKYKAVVTYNARLRITVYPQTAFGFEEFPVSCSTSNQSASDSVSLLSLSTLPNPYSSISSPAPSPSSSSVSHLMPSFSVPGLNSSVTQPLILVYSHPEQLLSANMEAIGSIPIPVADQPQSSVLDAHIHELSDVSISAVDSNVATAIAVPKFGGK